MIIRPARPEEATGLARLLSEGLDSRLDDLGPWFVGYLYRHFIESDHAMCLVAERDGESVGCMASLVDRPAFYREFILRKGVLATLMVLPWLIRPRNIATALGGLSYSNRAAADDPPAELVSMVVSPAARRTGVGSALTAATLEGFRERGVRIVKVTTPTDNEAANALYVRDGFEFIRTDRLYRDVPVNVYWYRL